jgi:formylmethanofuran dehydrogenase subunit E
MSNTVRKLLELADEGKRVNTVLRTAQAPATQVVAKDAIRRIQEETADLLHGATDDEFNEYIAARNAR